MGWLDKAKVALGILDREDLENMEEDHEPAAGRSRPDRPPLDESKAPPQQSLEDAFEAREAGDSERMRQLLRDMDRGGGLRTVIRAAAAFEAGDEDELSPLLSQIRADKSLWRIMLQSAAALTDPSEAASLRKRAEALGAPSWALAWSSVDSTDEETARRALVDLLFTEPALARTVAARDLNIPGAKPDQSAAGRYASFSHGRNCIARFGADPIVAVLKRTEEGGS